MPVQLVSVTLDGVLPEHGRARKVRNAPQLKLTVPRKGRGAPHELE